MARNITVADIAREAGVSMMTVSRVINQGDGVSEATRQRIQKIIKRLNYRPSAIARSLATRQTGTLGLVLPDISNPFFAEVARGAENLAYSKDYNVFLCNTEEDTQRELASLVSLEEKRVDGVVLSSRLTPTLLSDHLRHLPVAVLINRRPARKAELPPVGVALLDDVAGGEMVTRHLVQRGHRAIGFLAGPSTSYSGRARAKGYQRALAAVTPPRPEWQFHCLPTVEGGLAAARELLLAQPTLTALFCYNDLVAVGAIQACVQLGRRVPQDVAIAGYDDIPLAALVTPSLTTCRTPRYELGAEAVRLLLNRIQGCTKGCEEVILKPQLVVRSSAP